MKKSTNQFLKPITTTVNDYGNLEIGGCDLSTLAKEFATPLYVIDEQTLRSVCKDYISAFKNYSHINLMYASKALCTLSTSRIIESEGFGFDTVSIGEIYTVYKAGCNMKNVLFNGNNKTSEEIDLALKLGVEKFSVDNFQELSKLNEIACAHSKKVNILLRITPGIECHTHEYIQTGQIDSKFGFDMSQINEAVNLILKNYKNLNLKGLHAHIGSQIFETKVYKDEIDILVKELSQINEQFDLQLNEINIGGGLGVKYVEGDMPPSIYDIAEIIINELEITTKKYNIKMPNLYLEPGRSVISTSGVTLYTIGSSKQVPNGTKYVSVDGGMADNPRPAMYCAEYFAEIVSKANELSTQKVTISGRFCESGDILIKNIELPNPQEGDILCVYNTGAYNYSMASNYNSVEKPAMVLVNNSHSDIIIERENLDDVIKKHTIPNRLIK